MRFLSWLPLAFFGFLPPSLLPSTSLCGFKWLTGLPCPFCGLTHGMLFWMHGQFSEALHWHLLTPLIVLLILSAPVLTQLGAPQQKRLIQLLGTVFACYGAWRWYAIV